MENKLYQLIRDLCLLCALIILVRTAFENNYSFFLAHKKSIIHELDRSFIDQIYTAQRHIHLLNDYTITNDTLNMAIADTKSRLTAIEEKYKKNSPGLALLGPIGTAAIVVKEEQLSQKLLDTINDLGKTLYSINTPQEIFQPAQTIDSGLVANKTLIKNLLA